MGQDCGLLGSLHPERLPNAPDTRRTVPTTNVSVVARSSVAPTAASPNRLAIRACASRGPYTGMSRVRRNVGKTRIVTGHSAPEVRSPDTVAGFWGRGPRFLRRQRTSHEPRRCPAWIPGALSSRRKMLAPGPMSPDRIAPPSGTGKIADHARGIREVTGCIAVSRSARNRRAA